MISSRRLEIISERIKLIEDSGNSAATDERLEEQSMIEVRDVSKYYVNCTIKAAGGVSFTCPDGQITGLLGPNGAGKTTTLRIIAGLIKPVSGTVIIDGHDVAADPQGSRAVLGGQSDMTGVYPRLTGREQLAYYGRFYGVKGKVLAARVQ